MQRLHGRIVYSCDQLIALRPTGLLARISETKRMQRRTEAVEKRLVKTTEANGEEEIETMSPFSHHGQRGDPTGE